MNDFTKEELKIMYCNLCINQSTEEILLKIQSMIDNYCEQEVEEEILSCYTGLAVSDDFFCKKQSMDADDLLPAIHQLVKQCDGIIRGSGIYAIKLRLVKIK